MVIIYAYLCVFMRLFMLIFNKMCKIVSIYIYYMLKAHKKTNNLRYIAQLYTLLYILIRRLRLKNVYLLV